MCLKKVFTDIEFKSEGVGYKILNRGTDNLIRSPFRTFIYTPQRWVHDDKTDTLWSDSEEAYPTGFHIFASKRQAKRWCHDNGCGGRVFKTKYKNVVAIGAQWGSVVIVAKDMFLMEEHPISKMEKRIFNMQDGIRKFIKDIRGHEDF